MLLTKCSPILGSGIHRGARHAILFQISDCGWWQVCVDHIPVIFKIVSNIEAHISSSIVLGNRTVLFLTFPAARKIETVKFILLPSVAKLLFQVFCQCPKGFRMVLMWFFKKKTILKWAVKFPVFNLALSHSSSVTSLQFSFN